MFTGIIEEVGRVVSFEEGPRKRRLRVAAEKLAWQLTTGASIAVSGVCLTAADIDKHTFSADLAEETLGRTSLGRLAAGSLVNLELPARAGDRLGGHIVQGHVDGVAELVSFVPVASAGDYWLEIKIPEHLARYVVEKGSIAIEGISLTVARFENAQVSIAIIPHTRNATNLASKQPGDLLNIEVDVLAKYTEKLGAKTGHLKPPRAELSVIDLVARGF